MIANQDSLLWSHYATVIPVSYIDTLNIWHHSMNIIS